MSEIFSPEMLSMYGKAILDTEIPVTITVT